MITKQKMQRICLINTAISMKDHPTKLDILEFVNRGLIEKINNVHMSSIEKDLHELRDIWDVPLEYSKKKNGYYYSDPKFQWWQNFMKYWVDYIDFPDELMELIDKK